MASVGIVVGACGLLGFCGYSLLTTRDVGPFAVFLGSGACAGLAGVLFASETGTFAPTDGDAFLLPVVAIVILAGIALRGGRGHPAMLLISGTFLAIVPTALVFFGLNPYWQQAFQGLILVAAVSIDGQLQRRRRRQV